MLYNLQNFIWQFMLSIEMLSQKKLVLDGFWRNVKMMYLGEWWGLVGERER